MENRGLGGLVGEDTTLTPTSLRFDMMASQLIICSIGSLPMTEATSGSLHLERSVAAEAAVILVPLHPRLGFIF